MATDKLTDEYEVNLRVVAFIRDFCNIGSGEFYCTIDGSNFRIRLEIKVDDCNVKNLKN